MRLLHAPKPTAAVPVPAGPGSSAGRHPARFMLHLVQMCAVMCVSLVLLGLLVAGAAALGFSDLRQSVPVLSAVVVTLTLAAGMVAWMRFMSMRWGPTLEMAASTVLAGAVMITGYAAALVPSDELIPGCAVWHVSS